MGKQIHYLKGSVWHLEALSTLAHQHVNTAFTPPTTDDYTSIPVGMNMSHKEPYCLGPILACPIIVSANINQINHFLLALLLGSMWMTLFENTSLPTDTLTPALIITLLLSQKIEDHEYSFPINFISFSTVDVLCNLNTTNNINYFVQN
jgi:hypothetical protein